MTKNNSFTSDPGSTGDRPRIPLSVPHLVGSELKAVEEAFLSNWLGPIGPELASFEEEFAEVLGVPAALATASGTAALHLALRVLGVGPGDEVMVSTLTFCASVNPILYLGAKPVFVDSERESWNLDPQLLVQDLDRRGAEGRLPAAVIAVHLFGQVADVGPILDSCRRWGVPLIEDAAEALGANHTLGAAGTLGEIAVFSFDASKMITTSMGGMLVSSDPALIAHARKLARQAREPFPHYEHEELGYNYRLSNLLAAMGRVQLGVLAERVAARRQVFGWYAEELTAEEGIRLQPEASWGRHARWLTCLALDPALVGVTRETLRVGLAAQGIETRPVWKPMHLQPVYRDMGIETLGGAVAEHLFDLGLCLPSSSSLERREVAEICTAIKELVAAG
ncbi:MAG: DegT/DnrJ/EryC1/StrS family aminotransferase [Longimicrobiales bacterium]